jgi:putative peptide zinc metalloprotease protein
MAQQLHSTSWYRIAELRPRLRSHFRVQRHLYRGSRWYVLQDTISRRTHRFDARGYFVIGLMDGRRSMQAIWDAALVRYGDEAPTQEDLIRLLSQLHLADVVQCEATPDVTELLRRTHRMQARSRLGRWLAPLAIKIPLFDPDRLLDRLIAWYRPLFSPAGALLWLVVVGWGVFGAAQHWNELTHDLGSRVLAPENLLIAALVFPLIKVLHELGHACAVKAWGGEVHEIGVMFLVLMPVPYVDASAATAFAEKRRRVIVGAAGMVVEVFIAAVALFFWLEMQPGALRAVLFNVMVIAGVSTLLFNANPLLRFDGYYIFADVLEIPNLRQRAQQYLGSLVERRLFGIDAPAPEAGVRERAWLIFFAIASFIYRISITFSIALFIATQYFVIGVVLALWAAVSGVLLPIVGAINYLAFSPRLRRYRIRAAATSALLAAAVTGLVFFVPVPSWTNAQGVIWSTEQTMVRGGTDGFVVRLAAAPGSDVSRGQPLVETIDPLLAPRIRTLQAHRDEFEARYYAERVDSIAKAQMSLESMKALDTELARARERAADLVMRSPADGLFVVSAPADLPGRYVRQGELVGYVIPGGKARARVVVTQNAADLVRGRTERVTVKLAERLAETFSARIVREVPRAVDRVPSMALSLGGGGDIALDPGGGSGGAPKMLQTHFEFDVEIDAAQALGAGGRVYVRFDHRRETLAEQGWRLARQLFLKRFST